MFDQLLDFVKLSRLTVSTARRVLTAQITGAGAAGDDANAETLSAVEVVQPLGLLAYPTLGATTEALIARIGDTAVALGLVDKGGAAQAVEAGEVRLYGPGSQNATATVRIREDGTIEITSKSGKNISLVVDGAGDVVLDGGNLKVARATDPVTVDSALVVTLGQIAALLNAPGPVIGAPGAVTPFTGPTVGTITASAGAAHVKA